MYLKNSNKRIIALKGLKNKENNVCWLDICTINEVYHSIIDLNIYLIAFNINKLGINRDFLNFCMTYVLII